MMTPEYRQKIRARLIKKEGYEQFLYFDHKGIPTIAIGRNISPSGEGISFDEALYLLDNTINDRYGKLIHFFPWYSNLNEARQIALIDMSFCTGWEGFLKFHKMILAFENGDLRKASYEIINAKWEKDHHERAIEIAQIIETGEL